MRTNFKLPTEYYCVCSIALSYLYFNFYKIGKKGKILTIFMVIKALMRPTQKSSNNFTIYVPSILNQPM